MRQETRTALLAAWHIVTAAFGMGIIALYDALPLWVRVALFSAFFIMFCGWATIGYYFATKPEVGV